MQFGLKQLLIVFGLISSVVFLATMPLVHRQRMIANGVRYANECWPTNAVIYEWPPRSDSSTGILVTSHVDRESGLTTQTRGESEFRDAYNREISHLLSINGPPEYSLRGILPTETEIHRMFTAGTMEIVDEFPHMPTESIELHFSNALHIYTSGTEFTKGMSMCVDYDLPVYIRKNEHLIYVKLGDQWMGVFLRDGRLLFEVH